MMTITPTDTAPAPAPSSSADLQKALDSIPKAAPQYILAKKYLEGTVQEKFASSKFARLLAGSANKFRMNYARVPVMALCQRIRISSFGVDTDDDASTYLRSVWLDNGMENLYKEVHEQAAATGSAYVVAWPDADDETGESVDITIATQETTRVFYSLENSRKVLFAARMWIEGKVTRVNLYYADRIEKYVSRANGGTKTAKSFDRYIDVYEDVVIPGDGDDGDMIQAMAVWPIPNPFGRVPVFHFHIGGGYGRPVNRDAWEPQDGINKITSAMMSNVDYTSAPQRYILQNPTSSSIETEVDGWDDDESTSFIGGNATNSQNNGTLSPTSRGLQDDGKLQGGPGTAWLLDAKGAGQFDAADPDKLLKPMDQYIKAISTTTDTPLHAFHGMGDAPSGESLRVANAPLNDKVKNTESYLEPTWIELFNFLLECGGFGERNLVVSMAWSNPEMADDLSYWQAVKTKIQSGVPAEVVLEQAGYDPERVKTWDDLPTFRDISGAFNAAPAAAAFDELAAVPDPSAVPPAVQ